MTDKKQPTNNAGSVTSTTDKHKAADITHEELEQLRAQIKELALSIDEVEDEKLEITNKLKKALADYQNLERSIENRMEIKLRQLKKGLAESLIPIVDDTKFAIEASEKLDMTAEVKAWVSGTIDTLEKMKGALSELGVEVVVVTKGDEFDSSIHEALTVVNGTGQKSNTVVEMIQPGYVLGDQVIRSARVVVAKD